MAVKLIKHYRHFNTGECVDFGEVINQKLVDAKIAEPYTVAKAKPTAKQAGKPAVAGDNETDQTKTDGSGDGQSGANPPAGE